MESGKQTLAIVDQDPEKCRSSLLAGALIRCSHFGKQCGRFLKREPKGPHSSAIPCRTAARENRKTTSALCTASQGPRPKRGNAPDVRPQAKAAAGRVLPCDGPTPRREGADCRDPGPRGRRPKRCAQWRPQTRLPSYACSRIPLTRGSREHTSGCQDRK